MATGFFHHIGTFLLFAATILLIITCISAPVVHDLSILKVELGGAGGNGQRIAFGTFGYCLVKPNADDACSTSHIGYSPSAVLRQQDGTQFSTYADDSARALTRAMVLHPIACGINFIAFLLALGAGTIGSFLASVVALLAFLVTAIACIIDFVLFSIVKSNVNDRGAETGTGAYYGAAAWTILVSAICSLIGAVVVFFTCCSARRHKRAHGVGKTEYASPPRRRRFGIF
ncbi:actin cortical patch SUR7/pH-response regulator pali [Chaetomium sp. MPI-SDFR-AT-0129]|nr:actin cortical patch SUR7/pH-response regulator pali [Chaetomium sp. MPI-SDFR-AT-0129]